MLTPSLTTTNTKLSTSTDQSNTNPNTNNDVQEYKRVYPDWKPSTALEQTDVIATIQAIAGIKDKRSILIKKS